MGALAEGLAPKAATDLGLLPTPAIAFYSQQQNLPAAIVSASHNPWTDNGIKLLAAGGRKLTDEIEVAVSVRMTAVPPASPVWAAGEADGAYERHLVESVSAGIRGMHVVVDCANGAAYKTAPAVLTELGADVTVIGNQPDGLNINRDVGSTHLEQLKIAVRQHAADVGIALDGDADRCLMVDANGAEIDGDQILFVIARQRLQANALKGPVVGTLMSNLGLEIALKKLGLDFKRAQVGDRYVLEMLRASGGIIGGETSGHTICLDRCATGDGTITALQVLSTMIGEGKPLADLARGIVKFPQVLINVKIDGRAKPLLDQPTVQTEVTAVERELGARGRVLLRASGTEPLIRVMVEADDDQLTRRMAERIADKVRALAA